MGEAMEMVTKWLSQMDPDGVAEYLDADARESARRGVEYLRRMADRIEAAIATKMKVVRGGR